MHFALCRAMEALVHRSDHTKPYPISGFALEDMKCRDSESVVGLVGPPCLLMYISSPEDKGVIEG